MIRKQLVFKLLIDDATANTNKHLQRARDRDIANERVTIEFGVIFEMFSPIKISKTTPLQCPCIYCEHVNGTAAELRNYG